MKFRFWYIEVFFVVIFFVGIFSIPFNPPPENPDFVPNAVNGLTTLSGIMIALIGYLITYILPRIPDTPKVWIGKRIVVVLVSIAFGLVLVMGGLTELVFGSMQGAYNTSLFGTVLIILAFLEVMSMVAFRELEQTTNLSGAF